MTSDSRHSVREFLRSTSFSESSNDDNYDPRRSSVLLRAESLMEYEYKHRSDHSAYPAVKPKFVNVDHMILMVGLPARGKTYISRKLCRYLNWCGIASKVFNVGEYRRRVAGTDLNHEFFKPDNTEAEKLRQQSYQEALNDARDWVKSNETKRVAIFDATNSTKSRRAMVYNFCLEHEVKPFFIESIIDNPEIISSFIKDLQDFSPDYQDLEEAERVKDFSQRVDHYKEDAETICDMCEHEREFSYIKIIEAGQQFLVNKVDGYLQSQVVYYLMNIHTQKRSLYITVHGECKYNVKQELGGNSGLTDKGVMFASALAEYMKNEKLQDLRVWTSPMQGCMDTAQHLESPTEVWRNLEYLDTGDCHGMKFADLEVEYPDQFTSSCGPLDFHWRYPGGESYHDMLSRLEPVIMELERQHNVLVVSHRTTIRSLMAYFLGHNPDEVTRIQIPLHTVFKITPLAYGCRLEKAILNEETGKIQQRTYQTEEF